MSKDPVHPLATLSDDDWHLIVVALVSARHARSFELAQRLLDWRINCARSQAAFLSAFRELHKL